MHGSECDIRIWWTRGWKCRTRAPHERPCFVCFVVWPTTRLKYDFYHAMLCMSGTSHGPVSVSVTSRCSTKTAKCWIIQTTPLDSPGILVFWRQRSTRNSTGVNPCAKCRWVDYNRRLLTNNRHSAGFLGWPFQIKYTEVILSNTTRKLLLFEITKMMIAV